MTPTVEQFRSLTYYDIAPEPVELRDGHWVGSPFVEGSHDRLVVDLVEELIDFGDLNGDGVDDAAVLLTASSAATADSLWVAAVGAPLGQPSNYGSAPVGERTQIRSMAITENGWIRMEVVDGPPGKPPEQLWIKEWALVEGNLMQVSALVVEPLSTAVLRGVDWVLSGEPQVTARFEEGQITGSSGCNSYFADFSGGEPGRIRIGEIAGTRKACPPPTLELEKTVLTRLRASTGYGFHMGKLALSWEESDQSGTLLFEAASM